jgi:NapC/NirT cytochrome c family, N-terminal region
VGRLEGLVRHPLAIAGALITTASAVVFIALTIAAFAGMFANPYAGLVIFIAIPAVFVSGLVMIPAGMWLQRKKLERHPDAPAGWQVFDFRERRVRHIALAVVALTAVNGIIVLLAGYGSLHYMESPAFCGQTCHVPMTPQFTAWQAGPHAKIACVSCHIGEGPKAFVHAKLAGVRQLAHVITGKIPQPIPPGAHMPPGTQAGTCVGCHQASHVTGDRIRVIREYADDEANTETMTVLQMYLGGPAANGRSIHRHADPSLRIEYVANEKSREAIPYVKVTNAKGEVKEYRAAGNTAAVAADTLKTMDCVDCHNTMGHPIAPTAARAVDEAIAAGLISRALPYVRREGVRLLTATYPSHDAAAPEIERGLREVLLKQAGADQQAVQQAVAALQALYRRNVFPTMKVTWGSYPDHRGHIDSPGCVRCHDDSLTAPDGTAISGDCELCHKEITK